MPRDARAMLSPRLMGTIGSQAILTPLTEAAIFLVVAVDPRGDGQARALLTDVSGLRRSVGFRLPEGGLTCVVGVGSAVWGRLFGGVRPAELHPFPGFVGAAHVAVSTPGDLLFISAPVAWICALSWPSGSRAA